MHSDFSTSHLWVVHTSDQHTELSDGLLLHQPALDKHAKMTKLGRECHTALTKKNLQTPPMAFASGLWIGGVPDELKNLSLPESPLIACAFPCAYVVKLQPTMGGGDPTTTMDGSVRRHVVMLCCGFSATMRSMQTFTLIPSDYSSSRLTGFLLKLLFARRHQQL